MRLHVGIIRAEQGLGALDGQHLGLIDIFTAAIIALAGVTLGVFVGQHRALGLQHSRAGVVLRGNQFDMVLLPALFFPDGRGYLVVEPLDGHAVVEHGIPLAGWGGHCRADPRLKAAHFTPNTAGGQVCRGGFF